MFDRNATVLIRLRARGIEVPDGVSVFTVLEQCADRIHELEDQINHLQWRLERQGMTDEQPGDRDA